MIILNHFLKNAYIVRIDKSQQIKHLRRQWNLFKNKKKPLIVCGGGVRYSEAAGALREFVESFNIPFAETQAGKSAIESTHPA